MKRRFTSVTVGLGVLVLLAAAAISLVPSQTIAKEETSTEPMAEGSEEPNRQADGGSANEAIERAEEAANEAIEAAKQAILEAIDRAKQDAITALETEEATRNAATRILDNASEATREVLDKAKEATEEVLEEAKENLQQEDSEDDSTGSASP